MPGPVPRPRQPTPDKKPHVGAHSPHVAPSPAKLGNMATPAKQANTGATSAQSPQKPATGVRQSSKAAKVLDPLRRSGGASRLARHELEKAFSRWRGLGDAPAGPAGNGAAVV